LVPCIRLASPWNMPPVRDLIRQGSEDTRQCSTTSTPDYSWLRPSFSSIPYCRYRIHQPSTSSSSTSQAPYDSPTFAELLRTCVDYAIVTDHGRSPITEDATARCLIVLQGTQVSSSHMADTSRESQAGLLRYISSFDIRLSSARWRSRSRRCSRIFERDTELSTRRIQSSAVVVVEDLENSEL
jgi:hypothetical protein